MKLSVRQGKKKIEDALSSIYPYDEIQSLQCIVLMHILNCTKIQLTLSQSNILNNSQQQEFFEIVEQLIHHKPVQYVLGQTEFYGLTLFLTPDVFIPRAETEELVEWIIKDQQSKKISVLDIATGSGCIAIALATMLSLSQLAACDISKQALQVAMNNALMNHVNIDFFQSDIFNPKDELFSKYDLIVSNPPYVLESERKTIRPNVVDYEPHIALFVEDADPIKFYKAIVNFAKKTLNINGFIYFEINEMFGEKIAEVLDVNKFCNIVIKNDIHGRQRMLRAQYLF